MPETPTERIDVRIPPTLKETLFEKAEQAGVKASAIVRASIEALLSKDEDEIKKLIKRSA